MIHGNIDTSEKGFQHLITKELVTLHGYGESTSNDFDREFCVNTAELFRFIETTQPVAWQEILKKGERVFLSRLDSKIKDKGIIETLRKGVKFFDRTIHLFYPQPNSSYNTKDQEKYNANIFSVTEELVYTDNNKNRLDLVIFINGLPIITMELKNAFTHQAVKNAIRQYIKDRSAKDKLFNFARCMVHFAADTDEVYMSTTINGTNNFLPFNKGQNDGSPHPPFGAGNSDPKDRLKTWYLWQEVLSKSSLANIIEKFAQLVSEKDLDTKKIKRKLIFPRYHQLKVVRELLANVKEKGVGERYLIQHSAGSGKSNSITWLAHQLVSLYDKSNTQALFDCVVVVTDRTVLDEQIRKNIKSFSHVKRVVEAITGKAKDVKGLDPSETSFSKTTHMRLALANNKKLIICTVQTFPFVLDAIQEMQEKKVSIIIDEAHSSQSGQAAASMNALFADKELAELKKDEEGNISTEDLLNYLVESRKMLNNASYFAFTATPKNKTLETFGIPIPYTDENGEQHNRYVPFHTYSMKQAIEEDFILDVLEKYTTYQSYYKIRKGSEEISSDQLYDTKKANKKIRSYVEGNEMAIREKARIMIDHFQQNVWHLIRRKAKAMVVTKSIESAMKYKDAFDEYLQETNSPFKAIVAFSGKKAHYKTGEELTEEKMNRFPDNDNDIPNQFKKDEYRFLIVANKYQTGFDQPLLHTMYVDKELSDVQAVQTLSRLNRSHKPDKKDTFVLDFYNKTEDIKEAFDPFYTTTILSRETDANKLNDLQDELDYKQVYSFEEVQGFFEVYYSEQNKDKTRHDFDPLLYTPERIFKEDLSQDEQIDFKSKAKSFLRTYSYLSKLLPFNNHYWEMLWLYLKHLVPKLHVEEDEPDENILEAIDMETYKISKEQTSSISLVADPGEIEPIPVSMGGTKPEAEFDTLENIIKTFNDRFGKDIEDMGEGVDAEEAKRALMNLPEKLFKDDSTRKSIENSDKQNAKITSDKKLLDVMQNMMFTHTGIYKKFMDDPDFKNRYQEFIFEFLWDKIKRTQARN